MTRPSLGSRIRYAFDNTISRGPLSLLGWLGLVATALVVITSLVVVVLHAAPDLSAPAVIWTMLLQALAPNPVDVGAGPLPFLIAMLFITLTGLFGVSVFIGLLTTSIEAHILSLRQGRSHVIESRHTVILGWSEQIFTIIKELVIANANQKRACIVVLAEKDKVEMESEIRHKVGSTKNTRVVCRSGNPIDVRDLDIASLATCRSIIILSPEDPDPDNNIIKTILAITNNPKRRKEPYHIVASIHKPKSMPVANMVGRDETQLILTGDFTARIVAQTCHQIGLSVVYTELLNFEGDEIYFQSEPQLVGKTFGEALLSYEDSAVMGIYPNNGIPKLNPPMDQIIREGDQIIAISKDDDTVKLNGRLTTLVQVESILPTTAPIHQPEHILVLGWNWRALRMLNSLAERVSPGSEVLVVSDCTQMAEVITSLHLPNNNVTVAAHQGDTTDRDVLDGLDLGIFQHIILLSCSDEYGIQEADASTLVTLLHLRDIKEREKLSFSVVSEMMDSHNRALAGVTRADDFIVSDELISLMMTQVAENKELNAVFTDLFNPEGSEIYLKPIGGYVRIGEAVNFYTVVEAARRRGEVALGYRLGSQVQEMELMYGVHLNPVKSEGVVFSSGDRIIVLAEF
jgi:ion channel POLLUX/CASTOR